MSLDIAIALFPRVTALDAIGPYEVLQRLPGARVTFVAAKAMQLMIEYDPQPPFDCGAIAKAPEDVVARLIEYAADKS